MAKKKGNTPVRKIFLLALGLFLVYYLLDSFVLEILPETHNFSMERMLKILIGIIFIAATYFFYKRYTDR